MESTRTRVYEFGSFRLYPDQKLLFRLDERLDVDRKAMAVLELLIRNRGQLVSKERLLDEVWTDLNVEEGNVGVQVSKVRKVLGDERKQAEYIETIHGEGYRFIASVTEKVEELYPEERPFARSWILALVALLVVGAIVLWIWRVERPRTRTGGESVVSTASADARSRYEQAVKYESEGDDEEALAALHEATVIDKDFAEAYLKATFISNQLGEQDEAVKYLTQARNCRGIRNEQQRLRMDALEAELTASYQEGVKKYRLLVDAYPNDIASQYYFADFAMQSRRGFAEAGDALGKCLRLDPGNRYCNFDRMNLYVLNNEFDKAIDLYNLLSARIPYPWFDEPFGLALYGKGDLAGAREVLQKFSRGSRTHELTRFTSGREWLADIDFFEGKIAAGSSEIKVLLPSDSQYGVSAHFLYLAKVYTLVSNHAASRDIALKAVAQQDDRDTRVEAASILACGGYPKDADRLLHLGGADVIDDLTGGTQTFIDGCKALDSGDSESAVRELQASYDIDDDLDTQFFLGKAYMAARRWENAIVILKDLEASKGRIIADQSYPPVIWALAHYYIAVAYDESGQKGQAISYYSKFLKFGRVEMPT
jgi:DNA-binding winged helix-turn-helix (wHTH) protein